MNPRIAILGTGPSSLYLGLLMSHRGWEVKIFDPRTPWERPRGAGLVPKALSEIPDFDAFHGSQLIEHIRVISPRGREGAVHCPQPIVLATREGVTDYLQERVLEQGIEISAAKFEGFQKSEGRWLVRTNDGADYFDFLAAGEGGSSVARNGLGLPLTSDQMTIEVSYEVPHALEDGKTILIRFLRELSGCFWAMPGPQGTIVRLWATSRQLHARHLLERLDQIAHHTLEMPAPTEAARSIAYLPVFDAERKGLFYAKDWALVGDAAGLVNPLTQDGLYFGLKSSAVLALSLQQNQLDVPNFQSRLKHEVMEPLLRMNTQYRRWHRGVLGFCGADRLARRLPHHEEARHEVLRLFGA